MNESINQNIKLNLFSPETDTVILAINSIKERGNKHYIPLLFDLLNSNPEEEIKLEISNLLATVKDKETVNTFMRAVEDEKYKNIRKTILTACWQNGLDFSNFLPVFVDLVISGDWEISFEAFTIIDNLESLPPENIIHTAIKRINNAIENVNDQKKYFLREILTKLE